MVNVLHTKHPFWAWKCLARSTVLSVVILWFIGFSSIVHWSFAATWYCR